MGGMKRHVFRAADDLGAIASIVTRTFGFVADGRELVEEEEEETSGAIRVRFPDRAEEGWPAFELFLPATPSSTRPCLPS